MRMTPERFETLAEAYGGDVSRWPLAERDGAALLMAQAPQDCQAVLAAAGDLDGLLDAWRPQPAPHALREAILAAAPAPRAVRRGLAAWLFPAGLGAGLAAACAAGVITGAQISALGQAPEGVEILAGALTGYDGGVADTNVETLG
jgi:hypothetical protein